MSDQEFTAREGLNGTIQIRGKSYTIVGWKNSLCREGDEPEGVYTIPRDADKLFEKIHVHVHEWNDANRGDTVILELTDDSGRTTTNQKMIICHINGRFNRASEVMNIDARTPLDEPGFSKS